MGASNSSTLDAGHWKTRVRLANAHSARADGQWVVYWMTAFRRSRWNFALQRARDWCRELGKPLLVLEALRIRYPWASDRLHHFVIEGMRDNAQDFEETVAFYYPYVEPRAGQGRGLLETLARQACLVVTDDYPCFFHPRMVSAVSRGLPARLELVDSNGLMPLAAWDRTFTVAHSYRRAMQKALPDFLDQSPEEQPLSTRATLSIPRLHRLPAEIQQRWPPAIASDLLAPGGLAAFDIDHSVGPTSMRGGSHGARQRLRDFVKHGLDDYDQLRNHPDLSATSQLSPYLHFGHLSAHQVFWEIMRHSHWHPGRLGKPNGSMEGFWNTGPAAEAYLDQLCTWRELGFNMCYRQPDYDRYESLPQWALQTLADHQSDRRPHLYALEELEAGRTSDRLWNAAQHQLVREGRIHNYLRMLWGKNFLQWTPSAEVALEWMIHLNNKYALDGRDPNSYSGIFWVLGRYDRAWGPERPIYGKVRYMTSHNTLRKVKVRNYLAEYAG